MKHVEVPFNVWQEVHNFFAQIVEPCQNCVWGTPIQCWKSECAAFNYRPLARDVMSVHAKSAHTIPDCVKVENEILEVLKSYTHPIHPSSIKLWTTNSRVIKSKAISRLVNRGLITEHRINSYTRYISLPKKEN